MQLYSAKGSQTAVISKLAADELRIKKLNEKILLFSATNSQNGEQFFFKF